MQGPAEEPERERRVELDRVQLGADCPIGQHTEHRVPGDSLDRIGQPSAEDRPRRRVAESVQHRLEARSTRQKDDQDGNEITKKNRHRSTSNLQDQ
ncbi:MAG: hypothetical protein JWN49_661 [Parcubacteria group bacterium]|nr:hypothetical protein [Parcubacteria group bacterium]